MKLLIIGPKFFSYMDAISTELNARGVDCYTFDELHSDSVAVKVAYRLNLSWLFAGQVATHRRKIFKFIEEQNVTDVLFVSPDVIDARFLGGINERARSHLYMWDGFANKSAARSLVDGFCTTASFDPMDCVQYGMTYIPLFAESEFQYAHTPKIYDFCFCGTVHSDRASWLKQLLRYAKRHKLKVGLLLYYFSPLLLMVRLMLNNFYFQLAKDVVFEPFTKREISELFKSSNVVVDLTHPNQIGLTSRTFEALRCGSKLLTNNKRCVDLEPRFPGRIFVLQKKKGLDGKFLEFLEADVPPLSLDQDYFLSVERFSTEILENISD